MSKSYVGLKALDVERDNKLHGIKVRISDFTASKNNYFWREGVNFEFKVKKNDTYSRQITFGFGINGSNGTRVCTYESNKNYEFGDKDELTLKVKLTEPHFVPSRYTISLGLRSNKDTLDYLPDFAEFNIMESNESGIHYGLSLIHI